MEKLKISKAILVEGKYDKICLERFIDGHIFTTGGFSIFNSGAKAALFRKIAEKQGIIILTDSDPAGFVIRNKLKGMLPPDKVTNIYAPALYGKEKRKIKASKAGILGIEGIDIETLRELFIKCGAVSDGDTPEVKHHIYTKAELYEYGLCGRDESSALRDALCEKIGLPKAMTPNALLEAINILGVNLDEV